MKKTLHLIVLLFLFAGEMYANRINVEDAFTIASEFLGNKPGLQKAQADNAPLRLAEASDGYYAFTRGSNGGFVIVAADDRAINSVLGYADEGSFNPDSLPDAMRWWLGEYERQLSYAETATNTNRIKAELPIYAPIAPLITTRWDQTEPYNLLCPVYNGNSLPSYQGMRCYTGCVATAWAQIMYYHKWPIQGTGSHSYMWTFNGENLGTLSADFSQSVYNWDAMTDTYDNSSSEESRYAVAQLMSDVGIASDMGYSPLSSGANSISSLQGIVQYFGYDPSAVLLQRNYYGLEEWQDSIYASLAAGYPVYYAGQNNSAGHAFICDGYNNGYFHINWGWSGMSNGYFLLTALDPEMQGSGGSDAGYNYLQQAATYIRPAEEGSQPRLVMLCSDNFDIDTYNATRNTTVTFSGDFFNVGIATFNITLGIKVVDSEGTVTYVAASSYTTDLEPMYGFNEFDMKLTDFPTAEGTYKVYPACRDNNTRTWYEISTSIQSTQRYLIATVEGPNSIVFSAPSAATPELSATTTVNTPLYTGKTFLADVSITNSGDEYYNDIYVATVQAGTMNIETISNAILVNLTNGGYTDISFKLTAPETAGDYELYVIDYNYYILSDPLPITVVEAPTEATVLSLASPITMDYEGAVVADDIRFSAQIECSAGYYGDKLYAFVFPEEGGTSITSFTTDLYIGAGETQNVSFNGNFVNAEIGETYFIALYYLQSSSFSQIKSNTASISEVMYFTVGMTSGINDTKTYDEVQEIEVYNLMGIRVLHQRAITPDLSTLAPGIYIVRTGNKVERILKR